MESGVPDCVFVIDACFANRSHIYPILRVVMRVPRVDVKRGSFEFKSRLFIFKSTFKYLFKNIIATEGRGIRVEMRLFFLFT